MSSNIQIIRHCEYCRNPFNAKTTVTRFCSHKCNSRSHKQKIRELKMQVSNQMTQTQVVDTIKESVRKDEVLTVREVAELLKASREAVYFMIKSGRLKATKLSPRNTRIYRSDFEDFFKSEPPAVVPNLRNEKVKEETILTRENCFSVSEVVTLFGQERGNVYSILSRENVPKIKIGKEAFYSINEVNRVYKKLQKPRPLGLEEVRKANRRKSDKPLEKKDCYSIKRCEQLLNKDRSNLYGLFKRRGIPKLRIGQEAYYAKSGVDKIVRSLKEKEEM